MLFPTFCRHFSSVCQIVFDFWSDWHVLILSPIVLVFLLPLIILIFLYGTVVFLHIYKHRRRQIYDAAYNTNFWDAAILSIAAFYDAQASIWHGYEICGLENIPDVGPALLVYYHGTLPVDIYYLMGRLMREKKRILRNVVAHFMFSLPGFKIMMNVFGCVTGPVEECVRILKNGDLLAVSPGGVREALFSDESYKLIWNSRLGFAKVALKAGVPVIPMFTQNIRDVFRTPTIGRGLFRWFYEKTKLPIAPIYGGFPVKLKTFIGSPIVYDSSITPEELAQKVQDQVEQMIQKHQRLPGSILRALQQRWHPLIMRKKTQ